MNLLEKAVDCKNYKLKLVYNKGKLNVTLYKEDIYVFISL